MTSEDLLLLLQQSRQNNKEHKITGMLLYVEGRFVLQKEGRFMQVLEGSEQDVNLTFDKILHDSRHHNVMVLKRASTEKRNFDTWSMGFNIFEREEYEKLPGYFNLDDEFLNSELFQKSNSPLIFLKSFYETNRTYDFDISA